MVIRATLWIPVRHKNKPASTAVQNCTRQSIFLTEQVLALSMAHLSHFQDQANVAVQPCAKQPCHPAQRHLVSSVCLMQTCSQP